MAIGETTASATATADPATLIKKSDRVDKDAFLQLLVAKLANQDPLNPASNEDFLGQLAQLQSLEETQSLNENISGLTTSINDSLGGLLRQQSLFSGSSMIGSIVRANGEDGIIAGKVTKAHVESGEVKLTIQQNGVDKKVGISDIIEVTGE